MNIQARSCAERIIMKEKMTVEHFLDLSLDGESSQRPAMVCRCGDASAHLLSITLYSEGEPYVIPKTATVSLYARCPDGKVLFSPCTVCDDGRAEHVFTSSELSVPGRTECEVYVVTDEAELTSPVFSIVADEILRDDEAIAASDEFSQLSELVRKAENMAKIYFLTLRDQSESTDYLKAPLREIAEDSDTGDIAVYFKLYPRSSDSTYALIPATLTKTYGGITLWGEFADADDIRSFRKVTFNKSTEAVTVTARASFAAPDDTESEEFYYSAAPTVQTAVELLGGKQEKTVSGMEQYFSATTVEGILREIGAELSENKINKTGE